MSYRRANALTQLVSEVDKTAPKRKKVSDGWIGDAAHASRDSDHNPWVKDRKGVGVVRAQDITHDPDTFSARKLANLGADLLGTHPALGNGAYVIFEGQIISTARLREGWRPYGGSNGHYRHAHFSTGIEGYDSKATWGVKESYVTKVLKKVAGKWPVYLRAVRRQAKAKKPKPTPSVRRVQKSLVRKHGAKLRCDGVWGPATELAYGKYQKANGFRPTGVPKSGSLRKLVKSAGYLYLP